MDNIVRLIKSLEDLGVLLETFSERVKQEVKR